ncbi:efflux RND transporter periplasmic adaptor subunit [Flavitalea sp.]|nr:efflux RND transporter periplasmic adaptor subunit [Flavitalea sp.]
MPLRLQRINMKEMNILKQSTIAIFLWFSVISCGDDELPQTAATAEVDKHEETNRVGLTESQYETAGIISGEVERKQISGTFKVNGVLDVPPQQQVSISVPMGGFLKKTDMLEGKKVRTGELLAVIENPEYIQMQQDYLEAKSRLEYANADYERQLELSKENINALKTVQQAKSNFQTLTAKVNSLKEKIKVSGLNLSAVDKGNIQSSISLYSPINGYVTEVNANIGKFVNASDVIFEIVDTEHLHAELTIFEKDVPKLKIGQKVRFTLANETKERTAQVYLIGREISEDRTVRIHCHIDVEDQHLLPGMYLSAIVESGQVLVPALPNQAIVDFQGQKFVFIQSIEEIKSMDTTMGKNEKEEGHEKELYHFTMVPVQAGNSDGGYTEVKFDKNIDYSTKKIVIKGAYDLLSKLKNSETEDHH